jgi:hypothetical protein
MMIGFGLAAVPMTNYLAPHPILGQFSGGRHVDCRRARAIEACTVADTDRADHHWLRHRGNRPQILIRPDVRFGSLADMCSAKGHVRFTPESDMCSATRYVR